MPSSEQQQTAEQELATLKSSCQSMAAQLHALHDTQSKIRAEISILAAEAVEAGCRGELWITHDGKSSLDVSVPGSEITLGRERGGEEEEERERRGGRGEVVVSKEGGSKRSSTGGAKAAKLVSSSSSSGGAGTAAASAGGNTASTNIKPRSRASSGGTAAAAAAAAAAAMADRKHTLCAVRGCTKKEQGRAYGHMCKRHYTESQSHPPPGAVAAPPSSSGATAAVVARASNAALAGGGAGAGAGVGGIKKRKKKKKRKAGGSPPGTDGASAASAAKTKKLKKKKAKRTTSVESAKAAAGGGGEKKEMENSWAQLRSAPAPVPSPTSIPINCIQWDGRVGKWNAQMSFAGSMHDIGTFDTRPLAVLAYQAFYKSVQGSVVMGGAVGDVVGRAREMAQRAVLSMELGGNVAAATAAAAAAAAAGIGKAAGAKKQDS